MIKTDMSGIADWIRKYDESFPGYSDLNISSGCSCSPFSWLGDENEAQRGFIIDQLEDGINEFIIAALFDYRECFTASCSSNVVGPLYLSGDLVLFKLDENGDEIDIAPIDYLDGLDLLPLMVLDKSKQRIYTGGNTTTLNNIANRLFALEYDYTQIWTRDYYGDGDIDCTFSMDLAKDGGLIFAGNNELGGEDYFMIKLHPDCDTEEDYTFTNGTTFTSGPFVNEYVWNTDKYIKGTITIESGATLTINNGAQIYFADTRHTMDFDVLATNNFTTGQTPTKIVIKPGGKLVIDGGTGATKTTLQGLPNCDNMWEGIEVWGAPGSNQTVSHQGYLEINNGAVLKDMFKGVTVGKTTYPATQNILEFGSYPSNTNTDGGGIVKVLSSGGTFQNNRISVSFAPYQKKIQQTRFENADFICDSYLKDVNFITNSGQRLGQEEHIWMYNIGRIIFYDCNFTGFASIPFPEAGMGISALDASPKSERSVFQDLDKGIYGTYSFNNMGRYVHSRLSEYYNCHTGIELHGGSQSLINEDTYEIDNVTGEDRFGIVSRCATNFHILNSTFTGMGSLGSTTTSYGVLTEDCGDNTSYVFGSDFENLYIGNQTQKDCGTTQTGLFIKCNTYDTMDETAWAIAPAGGGSLPNQGMPCAANAKIAGNEFLDASCSAPITDFYHINSTVSFDYYGTFNVTYWMPTCINSAVNDNNCGSNYNSNRTCLHPCPSCNSNQLRAMMDTAHANGDKGEYEFLRNELVRYYYEQDDIDSVIWVLRADSSEKVRKLLIGVYMAEAMYDSVNAELAKLTTNDENSLFAGMINYYVTIGGLPYNDPEAADIIREFEDVIWGLANSEFTAACNAQALLETFYGYSFPRDVETFGEGRYSAYRPVSNKEFEQLIIYPNPFTDFTTIEYAVSNTDNSYIVIYDVTGKVVKRFKLNTAIGTLAINGSELQNGMYFCQLLSEGMIMKTSKLVLTK